MRGRERPRDLSGDLEHPRHRQRPFPEKLSQRLARHVLADQEQLVVEFLERIHGGYARMRQAGRRLRFPTKTLPTGGVAPDLRRQRLQRHAPEKPGIVGEVDDSHPAAAQLLPDDVRADDPSARLPVGGARAGRRHPSQLFGLLSGGDVLVEQRRHVGAQPGLTGTGGTDEVVAFLRIPPERVGEDLACPLRLGRSHGNQPATRRGTAFAYTSIDEMFAQPDAP